jgi:F0F1-type ATP synthase assembly protein I
VRYSGLALSFGLLMLILAGLGFLGGKALDQRLGSFPLCAVLGVLAGIGLAFYDLLRDLNLAERAEKRRRAQGRRKNYGRGDP